MVCEGGRTVANRNFAKASSSFYVIAAGAWAPSATIRHGDTERHRPLSPCKLRKPQSTTHPTVSTGACCRLDWAHKYCGQLFGPLHRQQSF